MAEIKIEKKTPVWPWVLVVLIIISILIYVFVFNDDDQETDEREETHTEQKMEESEDKRQVDLNNSAVTAYVSFIREDSDPMGLDHEFTNESFSKLRQATTAMADKIDYNIERDLEELKTYTSKVSTDPFETTHANSIRKSAEILANVLKNVQQKAYSSLASEADEAKSAAMAIKQDVQTLNQKKEVKNFFKKSADLLDKINTNLPKT